MLNGRNLEWPVKINIRSCSYVAALLFLFLVFRLSSSSIKSEPADLVTWYFILGLRDPKFCCLLKSLGRVVEALCLKAERYP